MELHSASSERMFSSGFFCYEMVRLIERGVGAVFIVHRFPYWGCIEYKFEMTLHFWFMFNL